MIVNEHVVGRLGHALGAPVGAVALVEVPQELISLQPEMQHMPAGVSHGSRWIPRCTEREGLIHTDVMENRARFAQLAVLYGWAIAGDHQFIYENEPPHLVHSVDHGHFFPGGPDWTEASLGTAAPPYLDHVIAGGCAFSQEELAEACGRLGAIADSLIADVVAGPPPDWGVADEERLVLAMYLATRRDQFVASLSAS